MNSEEKLIELIQGFDTAMLITRSDDGSLHGRPMAIAEATEDGILWFVTDRNSGKIEDLILDQDVAVTMQGSSVFASISGECQTIDDRGKLDDLWREGWKVWFLEGKQDSSIILLRINPTRGEYWDNSGTSGIRYLIKAGTAYLQGERASTDEKINASVNL